MTRDGRLLEHFSFGKCEQFGGFYRAEGELKENPATQRGYCLGSLLGKCDHLGKVKFLRNFALGYSDRAGQLAGWEPDRNGHVAFHHAFGRIADAKGFGGIRCDTQRFDRDVIEL
jgi:hypothetical protein